MRSTLDIFRELPVPQGEEFSVEAHPTHPAMLVAKDANGAPAVLCIGDRVSADTMPVKLRNVVLLPRARVEIRRGEERNVVEASVYHCRAASIELREYCVVAVAAIVGSFLEAGAFDAGEVLRHLAELFHHLEMPARTTVQGLWGELFLIHESSEPAVMLDAWHSDPFERFDFARGAERIEVKTCSDSGERRHHFSLAQVRPGGSITATVASLFCARSVGGVSVQELVDNIRGRLRSPGQTTKLELVVAEALGEALSNLCDVRFDRDTALASLRFFPVERIPSVAADLPDGVTNVHFEARLADALALSPSPDVPSGGSLLAAAWLRIA